MVEVRIRDALAVLGLGLATPTPDELHDAYITVLRQHHPDTNPAPGSGRRAAEITAAYRFLCGVDLTTLAAATTPGPTSSTTRSTAPSSGSPPAPSSAGSSTGSDPPAPPYETTTLRSEVDGGFSIAIIADDTIEIGLPTDLTAQFVYAAAHHVGEVIYLERNSGLLQLLVQFVDAPLCQIIVDLQGRAAHGTTELFCSVASMDDRDPPPIDAVTEFIATRLVAALDGGDPDR